MSELSAAFQAQLADSVQFIQTYEHFVVVSHVNPDADAISSTCAVGYMLERLGKRYTLINQDHVAEKFGFLWGAEHIIPAADLPAFSQNSAVISVDCADFSRIGEWVSALPQDFALLNIDHHATNNHFGTAQLISTQAASTTEVLYDLAAALGVELDEQLAVCIYVGLLTDTGGFRYSNTTPRVMHIASSLLAYGVNGSELSERLLERVSLAHIQLLRLSLSRLAFSADHKIAWMVVTLEDAANTGANQDDLEGLSNYPRNIEGVEIGILFKQISDRQVKISLRSSGAADVATLAQQFGGGGHARAAGATLNGSLDAVVDQVVAKAAQVMR